MTNVALILIAALAVNTSGFTYNDTRGMQGNSDSHAEKIKAEIQKRGIGEKSRLKVKLRDNAGEVKGYINRIDETSFQVTDRNSGRVTSIDYRREQGSRFWVIDGSKDRNRSRHRSWDSGC